MKVILLIMIGLSSLLQAEFTRDDANEVVSDSKTSLMWQDEPYTQAEKVAYDANTESGKALFWSSAINYCEVLSYGGHNDWRLPNFNELYSIADKSKYNPSLSSVFQNFVSSSYWSSTTYAGATSNAWGVNFYYGAGGNDDKKIAIMCVVCGKRDNLINFSFFLFRSHAGVKFSRSHALLGSAYTNPNNK